MSKLNGYKKVIVAGDFHCPDHDKSLLVAFKEFLKDFKPDEIIINGDLVDNYQISVFDASPERQGKLQEDFDSAINVLKDLRESIPVESKITYLYGNHDLRLEKYLKRNPGLYGLRSLTIPSLLNFKEIGVNYVNPRTNYYLRDILVTHGGTEDGCRISMHSGYSAKLNVDKKGTSVISGHTHRMSTYFQKTDRSLLEGYESGCMCKTDMEYCKSPNWQQGFVVVYVGYDGRPCFVFTVPVIGNKFMFNEKEYQIKR